MDTSIIIAILSLLFGGGCFVRFGQHILARIKVNDDKTNAVCYGVQALLRDRLYDEYDKYTEKGFAPKHVKENFENMYKRYHALGQNGVMDSHYKQFMRLPDRKEKEA